MTSRPAALAGLLFAMAVAAPSSLTLAAESAASPTSPGDLATVEAWLDATVTPDAPAGGVVEIGFTFWDTARGELAEVDTVVVRLRPATGTVAPSVATARADWPGHAVAGVVVPAGGVGKIEVAVHGPAGDVPLSIAGVGPPPDARPVDLVGATLLPVLGDVVARRPFQFGVVIQPRGLWDDSAIALPDRLAVSAGHPGGPVLATATLKHTDGPAMLYIGELTFPKTGEFDLAVAFPDGGDVPFIAGSTGRLTVIEPGRRADASPGAVAASTPGSAAPGSASPGEGPPVVGLAGIVLLLVLGVLGARWLLAER